MRRWPRRWQIPDSSERGGPRGVAPQTAASSVPTKHTFGMNTTLAERRIKTTKALRSSLLVVIANVDELSDLVEEASRRSVGSAPVIVNGGDMALRVERANLSVTWNGRRCELGNTMAFLLLERLARRPNECIPFDDLLDELWGGQRAYSTLRSTMCRLKHRLASDGLADLADRIDGSSRGHYRLTLQGR